MAGAGVTWVLEVKDSVKVLQARVTKMGAASVGPYQVDYLYYKAANNSITPLGLLHHSHFPLSSFLIGDVSNENKQAKCVSDRGMDLILPKLKAGLIPDHAGYFECSGTEYKLHDFYIRLGTASMANSTTKGTILEVEFTPTTIVAACISLLMQFTNELLNDGERRIPKFIKKKKVDHAPIDTLQQYKDIFTEMRRRTLGAGYPA